MQQAETIVAYLKGELPEAQRQEFEQRLAADADLQSAVQDYQTILEGFKGMRHESLRQEIAHWDPKDDRSEMEAQLQAYVGGGLDETAAAAFEQKLADNPGLKQRLEAYQSLMEGFKGMQQESFSQEVANWAKSLPGAKDQEKAKVVSISKKKNMNRRYAAAAVLLALLGVALWLFNPFAGSGFSYSAFRQNNYLAPAPDALVRGSGEELAVAARDFARGDYSSAAEKLSVISPQDELFVTARYLLGHTHYQLGQYRESLAALTQSLEPQPNIDYDLRNFNRDNAAWTRILAQLALMENSQDAEQQQDLQYFLSSFMEFADRSDTYYRKAVELERQLGK